jgi:hypothetical protein
MEEMELSLMQLIFTSVVFAASIVPLYFAVNIRSESQRIISLLLFIALLSFEIHSVLESFEIFNYDIFVKLCFLISACILITAYSILQLKSSHVLIGGMFGIAMITSFGVWMAGELLESTLFAAAAELHEDMDQICSGVMAGFGIFIIVRFLWLRRIVYVESRT